MYNRGRYGREFKSTRYAFSGKISSQHKYPVLRVINSRTCTKSNVYLAQARYVKLRNKSYFTEVSEAMKTKEHKKTLGDMQNVRGKKKGKKLHESNASRRREKKHGAKRIGNGETEYLRTYVLRALECTKTLSTLGHIEGEFTPLLLAELRPAATMVRRREWEKRSVQGKLTLYGTVMQALDYVYDLTEMGYIESDMAPLLSADLECAAHMIRQRVWTAPSQ